SGYVAIPSPQILGAPDSTYARSVAGGSYARNSNAQLAAYFQPDAALNGYLRAGFHEMHESSSGQDIAPNNRRNVDIAAGATKRLTDASRIETSLWHQDTDFDSVSGRYTPNTYVSAVYDNPYRDTGASAVWSRAYRGVLSEMQIGADVRRVSGSDLATNFSALGVVSATEFGSGAHRFTGVFDQVKLVAPSKRLDATLSARYDYWQNDGELDNTPYRQSAPAANGATRAGFHSGKGSFNPSAALRWQATDAVALRTAAYRAFHAPGLNNMYRSFGSGASTTISNPDLIPETLTGYEVGMDYQSGKTAAKVTVYANDVKNLVTTYTLGDGTNGTLNEIALYCPGICTRGAKRYINAGEARMQGLESEIRYALTPAVTLNANFVYTDAVLKKSGTTDPINQQLAGIPRRTAFAGVSWNVLPRWQVYGDVRVVSETWNETAHLNRIPGYATIDLSTNYRLTKTVELFGSIVNLLDREYVVTGSPNSPQTLGMPFAAFCGLRVNL
ncbi:MAG: TonB-dependent receptor domain-containing protein, partial [Burkholderiaceae bacterium]